MQVLALALGLVLVRALALGLVRALALGLVRALALVLQRPLLSVWALVVGPHEQVQVSVDCRWWQMGWFARCGRARQSAAGVLSPVGLLRRRGMVARAR